MVVLIAALKRRLQVPFGFAQDDVWVRAFPPKQSLDGAPVVVLIAAL
jgi:hypothetical protein